MENILLIDKPKKITSNGVCSIIKKNFKNIKKIGHAGTLDPMATGLLIVGINSGTKKLSELINQDKQYIATIKFGIKTSTYDSEGEVINRCDLKVEIDKLVKILKMYKNTCFYQKPPIYSAIKIKGKKLYEYARKNIDIEIPIRKVFVENIELLEFDYKNQIAKILMDVKKGFYVRSFANDLAKKLNTCGYLYDLRRTKSGNFSIEDAIELETFLNSNFNIQNQ